MKKVACLLLLALGIYLVWSSSISSSNASDGAPYVASGSATDSLTQLLERSRSEQKPLVLLFTGSTWCPPCKAFARAVFTEPAWEAFVREDIIFVVYDFPRSGGGTGAEAARRNQIALQFQVEGFPTLIKVDSQGYEMDRIVSYPGGDPIRYMTWALKQ